MYRPGVQFAIGVIMGAYLLSGGCALHVNHRHHQRNNDLGDGQNSSGMNVGVKNLHQAYESLIVITGIEPDDEIANYYNTVRSRLSQDGNALSVSPAILMAMGGLSGIFCKKLVNAEAGQPSSLRRVFVEVDFTRGTAGFTAPTRTAVAKRLFPAFYQRDGNGDEVAAVENALRDSLSAGYVAGDDPVKTACIVACAAVASSLAGIQP